MRINLILIILCIMMSLTSCGQNRIPSTENEEAKNVTMNKIPLNENVLNEEWNNNENEDLDLPVDRAHWNNRMHNGTDCYFYKNNTFKIRIWWWYDLSGVVNESLIKGHYQYSPEIKEITLSFDEKSVAYYTMKNLKKVERPFRPEDGIEKDIPALSKSCLKIVEETGNEIRVDLYAFKENGKRISFGHQTYLRKSLEKEKE